MKEAVETKKVDEKLEKANDPNVKPSERMDAEFEANKAAAKAAEHHAKAEEHKNKHLYHHFTLVFVKSGLKPVVYIMNAVILTTILSARNSSLYICTPVVASILFGLSFIGNQIIYRWLVNTTGIIGFIA
ncbi:unnamed protein product [Rotaria sordida]|uniref:Uncharacterized protein n=1 Tax=Rotaria sordida TaxID=392033 RepID=A0A814Z3D3_9BILA|nr:unnamed protein product [Rotaria sordida]CAF1249870.1 unnamed protein product [Rotaria sordida]